MEKTSSEILRDAATLLEEEGMWNKGFYFKKATNKKGCTMCAHGAIAYCADRDLRDSLEETGASLVAINNAVIKASTGAFFQASEALTSIRYAEKNADHVYLTPDEVDRAKQRAKNSVEKIADNKRGWAHFAAMRSGLTTGFNDIPTTTQADVVAKLREAATQVEAEGK